MRKLECFLRQLPGKVPMPIRSKKEFPTGVPQALAERLAASSPAFRVQGFSAVAGLGSGFRDPDGHSQADERSISSLGLPQAARVQAGTAMRSISGSW